MSIAECLSQLSGSAFRQLPPASAGAVRALEVAAAGPLPVELRELYHLSNGLEEYLHVGQDEELMVGYLVLPAEEAAAENRKARQNPQSLTEAELVIFAHTYTDGGRFAYRRDDLPAASAAVYLWLPLEDELTKIANSLPAFLLGWATGQIRI
ncbi:SMI1/KNR4 family protein [Hymenobacter busanensis]|uniref:SMI1/KNR4 family protein n=1 Tax=Hymenobacter busanensis TaxID=2607656 RepID=A0A7L4ZTL0_9BACT|nr:SMI1/KNR4 family protein [Hymenobacter busanensis]KAA9325863.1 SMI1/KNR4 family protein [Hymenobacter busanensis]QHJ06297.1 hypothetical protein GUY19_02885 [Hymenobacter busanensis]